MRLPAPLIAILICCALTGNAARADPPRPARERLIDRVCDLIEFHSGSAGLPRDFFARLIWKESRFDPNAVSPVGAEGIAQFMPGTAKLRGLADSFDIEQAIPASAAYLGELKENFGNLGLAAAAYNAGENRVARWLSTGGFLPLETENYVLDIMGEPADAFSDRSYAGKVQKLHSELGFGPACRRLPVSASSTIAMATVPVSPWGVQVAGGFNRAAVIRQWQRLQARHSGVLEGHEPVVSRVRSPRGRRGIYAVRIGAESRSEADTICQRLRGSGGSCVVLRNR
ncbi:lytic transglycosylase domain-containing protein [Aquamicrobium ahrensii]|uniref:Lytic transglycosylase n=1 Tax=Aquamicrobium ahrensii TaxID=469551 RepID=A0ABV2KLR3_9HYPH